ncbi:MAG: hypothetical protein WBB19_02090 [Desulforhopalus sp.]
MKNDESYTIYQTIERKFQSGEIFSFKKSDLEECALLLSKPRAGEHFSSSNFQEIKDLIRMQLVLKVSEEANQEAKRHSYIALAISLIALLVATISTATTIWSLVNPTAVQVYSVKDKPVITNEISGQEQHLNKNKR